MAPTVSVVIPCYNAENWLIEALESCFAQSYTSIEIVVIDDGSTDASLDILHRYTPRIRVESGPNRGGGYARNRGFALSCGDYIQFLDADDYLLPDKIAQQVQFLEVTGADGVYGDWRHQYHHPDGRITFGAVQHSGTQADLLESLLKGWWVAPVALLFRRTAVSASDGWDENLRAGQDRDFLISMVLGGADIRYAAGCSSIYRRYGNITVSTADPSLWVESHYALLRKVEISLSRSGRLTDSYRHALARAHYNNGRAAYDLSITQYARAMRKALALDPFLHPQQSLFYNLVWRVFGFSTSEYLASYRRRVVRLANRLWRQSR